MAYVDARDVQDHLDVKYWEMNRQRKHEHKDGKVYCSIGILNKDTWVWKEDVGDATTISKDKWASSDAFKRAGVNRWIGRFLYSMPTFEIPVEMTYWKNITNLVRTTSPYKERLAERFEKESIKMDDVENSKYEEEQEENTTPQSMDDLVDLAERQE